MRGTVCTFVLVVGLQGPVAVATDPNTFICKEAGLSITKPPQWSFQTRATDRDVRGGISEALVTIVEVVKDKALSDDLSPTVIISLIDREAIAFTVPRSLFKFCISHLEEEFGSTTVKEGPTDVTFAGLKGLYARISATAVAGFEEPTPVCFEAWLLTSSKHFYFIDAVCREDERTGSRKELRQIVETIKITSKEAQPAGAATIPPAK